MSDLISLEAKGSRDLYWCYVLNEPVIIEYRNDVAICTHCSAELNNNQHRFMFHINKPQDNIPSTTISASLE
jgi:hypothetical protein